ncbi:hypothetical protein G9P44_001840 [Scheffersomyces stipitis]|nr:hypothetical protein G9P44_001840 [Scheffersomyces stipitis]
MVSIEVKSRSKSLRSVTISDLTLDTPVKALVGQIAEKNRTSAARLRVTKYDDKTKKQQPLDYSKSFLENGIATKKIELFVKDLGPQISWRTVFMIEYFGPLLIHPLFYYVSGLYGSSSVIHHTQTQQFAYLFVVLHFLKREYETVFVHKFSNDTMPVFNIFRNSSHYWILSGFNLAYFIYGQDSSLYSSGFLKFLFKVNDLPSSYNYLLAGLFIFAEVSNGITHSILANVRKEDTKKYVIPYGYGFDLVACPNYFFESVSWFAYALLVGNWSSWVFLFVATGQMWLWAVKKHKRYLKTFGDEYKKLNRKIYVPYVI